MPSAFAGALCGSTLTAGGVWNLVSSTRPWPSGGPHRGDVGTDVVEPNHLANPRPLDLGLAFQLHAQLGEEPLGSLKIFDNDENVVHPLNRHVHSWCRGPRVPWPFT